MDESIPTCGLQIAGPEETDWLRELEPDALLSFAPEAWAAETWVLHGMWERPESAVDPLDPVCQEPTKFFVSPVTGFCSPPEGWHRVRWRQLADRLGVPLQGEYRGHPVPPCFRWFPYATWPESVEPPNEGSLDVPTGDRLLSVLAAVTQGGTGAPCVVYHSNAGFPFGEWSPLTFRGPLRSVLDLSRYSTRTTVTPDNIWPVDRSWLLTTDYDLWGTRIAGSTDVIAAIEADEELETLRWP